MPTARVSSQARRVSTRRRRTSHRQGPRAPMALVERMVVTASLMVAAYTDRLMRALEPLLQERYGQGHISGQLSGQLADSLVIRTRLDALSLEEVFEQVREGELSRQFLERMFHQVDNQAANDLQRVVPVPLSDVLPDAARMQSAWVEKNTELIRLEERARQEVRAIIEAPIVEGVRVEEIRARIEERMGVVQSRAELIARDQTLKLYGQVQEQRQTDAGIQEYTWSTSDDERVRHRHVELEGTTQRWDSPPVVDPRTGRREHPGGDFQCRCAALPILPTGEEAPISEVRPSVRPANDVPPEERELAGPLPPDPMQVEREAEAERQRVEAARAAYWEAENARRVAEAAAREERRTALRAEKARLAAEAAANAEAERLRVLREAEERQQAIANRALEHAEGYAIHGNVSHAQQNAVLDTIAEIRPRGVPRLGGLEIGAEAMSVEVAPGIRVTVEGEYTPHNNAIRVATTQTVKAAPLSDLAFATSDIGETAETLLERLVTHEYGHHVHVTAGPRIDRMILEAYRAQAPEAAARLGVAGGNINYKALEAAAPEGAVSRYGTANHLEFFAEAFTSYMHDPEWMLATKPAAYRLVEDVLNTLAGGAARRR